MTENTMKNKAGMVGNTSRGNNEDEKKKKRRGLWIVVAGLCIVIAVLLMHQFGLFKFPWEAGDRSIVAGNLFPGAGDAADGHLPGMSQEEIMEQMQRMADATQFSFKINARPTFANGQATGDIRIENPNYNVYPMVVQIFLDETGEMLFDSGGILPNQHIEKMQLQKALGAGTYEATAVFNAYDPDTGEWQGKAQAAIVIIVQG
ncbi:MAG: hypothetical protein FWD72_01355 [Eggerthellaceae bacterium]|nr:hypothetical protein [Eggerthellaceae bacterium]